MSKTSSAYSTLSDTQLTDMVKTGDNFAFNELVSRYISIINHIAKKYSATGYERNDFLQEGLLGLLYSCKTYEASEKMTFKNYMALVVERRFISIIRKNTSQRAIPTSSVVNLEDLEEADEPRDFSQNPEDVMMYKEYLDALLNELKTVLSNIEYKVLMMFCSGQSYKQIAKTLSITPKSADNALQRARRKISSKNMSQ